MSVAEKTFTIDCRWLLALYLIIPFILVVVAVDYLLLDKILLQRFVPVHPSQWIFWSVVFNLPHIIASWVTFADKEYMQHYRGLFSRVLPLFIILVFVVHVLLGQEVAFIVFAVYTMYHVLAQQFGLTLMMLGTRPGKAFYLWKWLSLIGSLFIYAIVYGRDKIAGYSIFGFSFITFSEFMALICLLVALGFAYRLSQDSRSRLGSWYLGANVAMVTACLLVVWLGYYGFVIIIPRVIHDITAFIVYATHDHNRNKGKGVNYFYRLMAFTHLPPWLLCPLIAMAVAYPLTSSHQQFVLYIVVTLTYFHYYFESFIWRNGSLHRRQVSFVGNVQN